jgi:hypothetical protein
MNCPWLRCSKDSPLEQSWKRIIQQIKTALRTDLKLALAQKPQPKAYKEINKCLYLKL